MTAGRVMLSAAVAGETLLLVLVLVPQSRGDDVEVVDVGEA